MPRKKTNVGGRPTVMTEKVIKKLEEGFLYDLNVSQACIYAGIEPRTYRNYINKNPEMKERFEALRENVKMKAKINIAKNVKKGDVDISKWLLEHRAPDEYSKKINASIGEGIKIELSKDIGGLGE